jgi:mRNA interferase RelE/StbE
VPYQIEISKRVRKGMAHLPRQDQAKILTMIKTLAEEPRPVGCRPVKGAERGTYRVRVGDYRVIYVVLDDERVVVVARISRRSESTYQGV